MNDILNNLTEYFNSGVTRDVNFRIEALKKLKKAFEKYEPQIIQALRDDLRKPDLEIYTMEFGYVIEEIKFAIRHLKKWASPKRVPIPMYLQPAKGYIVKEPYGNVLIIGAFNYPFQLVFVPLVGAIAAGNCALVKPSKSAVESAKVIHKIIEETFDKNYIRCIMPDDHSSSELVSAKFDYIFFTGSSKKGALVAEAAGKNLVPYTLELGGKSPAIVDKTANLEFAAKKIAWGKFVNAGQTCIAPDFVYVDAEVRAGFVEELKKAVKGFFGPLPQESKDYGRIVNEEAFHRLAALINHEQVIIGGNSDECGLYIEPTVVNADSFDDKTMQDEIFGPILPVLTYYNIEEVIINLRKRPKPLALYVFSEDKKLEWRIIKEVSFGGGAVNEVLAHTVSPYMPFGGVGMSGIGQYHGKYSFDTFTHQKSILIRNYDKVSGKMYPPYDFEEVKKLRKFIG